MIATWPQHYTPFECNQCHEPKIGGKNQHTCGVYKCQKAERAAVNRRCVERAKAKWEREKRAK